MAASVAEIRAWARDQGMNPPARGSLSDEIMEAWESQTAAGPAEDSAADSASSAAPPPAETIPGEKKPREVGGARRRLALPGRRDKGKKKPGRAKARVPVDKLIAGAWGLLAQAARPIPPTSRLLRIQAPVAGLILEDVVKGTVVDKMLQPLARAEESGKALFALMGPPMIVTAIAMQPDYQTILLPVLREALRTWIEVAGPKFAEAAIRDQRFEEEYGADLDTFIMMLFTPPAEGQTEEDAAARAQAEGVTIIKGRAEPAA